MSQIELAPFSNGLLIRILRCIIYHWKVEFANKLNINGYTFSQKNVLRTRRVHLTVL